MSSIRLHRKSGLGVALSAVILGAGLFTASAQSRPPTTPVPGSWSGSVGPFAVHFTVTAGGSEITGLGTNFNPAADCGVPTSEMHVHFPPLTLQPGHFHGTTSTGSGETAWHYTIDGEFTSPRQASGTMSGHFRIRHNALPPCNASSPFKASAKQG